MASFTCISCRVAFGEAEVQRQHYKSDWHRYNLKRKVADMPPVTAEVFQEKVLFQRNQTEERALSHSNYCSSCRKQFGNDSAYSNHLQSKKHKKSRTESESEQSEKFDDEKANSGTAQVKMDADSDEDSWDEDQLGIEECLFCSHVRNVSHMTREHSFFIPDIEYLSDLEGLVTYLGEKISQGKMCLWCNERSRQFPSIKSVQQHMMDKGHCKVLHEGAAILEYTDYYDYRSSYPESDRDNDDDINDETVEVPESSDNDFELVLPSGNTIGHRSLMRYYKQRIPPERQLAIPGSQSQVHKLIAQYKALGWTGTTGHVAQKKARDQAFVQRMKNRHFIRMGIKGNVVNVKHYRDQVFGNRPAF